MKPLSLTSTTQLVGGDVTSSVLNHFSLRPPTQTPIVWQALRPTASNS